MKQECKQLLRHWHLSELRTKEALQKKKGLSVLVSEITRLKQQIEAEYIAATRGLEGLAYGTSRHKFISQKMENMERGRERFLVALVGEEQASEIFIETIAAL